MLERILTYSEGTYLSIEDGRGRWYVIDADVAAHLPPTLADAAADPSLIDTRSAPPEDVTATGALVLGVTRAGNPFRYCLRSIDGRDDLELTAREYASLRAAGLLAQRVSLGPAVRDVTRNRCDRVPGPASQLPG